MTNEEAKKMLEAKLKCLIAETSGTNYDCNMRLCDGCSLNYEQGNMGEQKQALDMAIKALEQRWIPVSERLPEDFEDVLVWYEYFRYGDYNRMFQTYGIGCYLSNMGAWSGDPGTGTKVKVFAWMPLPEPYKAESGEDEK